MHQSFSFRLFKHPFWDGLNPVCRPFSILSSVIIMFIFFSLSGCQNKIDYLYLYGEGRCANGKQDPDEFGVDCGGACPNDCQDVRYLEGEIFGRLSLDTRYTYILTGPLIVRDQGSLEFPAGTHLKVQAQSGAYIAVAQGGLFFAWGTEQDPVTISSNAAEPQAGDWGGIIFCGKAPIDTSTRKLSPIGNYYYGGDEPNDVSGYMRYLKIQHAGAVYKDTLHFSGLTLYGVGQSTVMDHVWVTDVLHNGIEIYGGTVGFEDVVVQATEQNGLSLTANWIGHGKRLFLHQIGANGIHIQAPEDPLSESSAFSLTDVSVVNASSSGIKVASLVSNSSFNRVFLTGLPTGILFAEDAPYTYPSLWTNFYLENIPILSNNPEFNTGFQVLDTPPFANANSLPSWLDGWND